MDYLQRDMFYGSNCFWSRELVGMTLKTSRWNIPCVAVAKAKRCDSCWCIRIEWIRIETVRIEGMRIETIWVEWCLLICMIWYTLTIFWKPLRRNVFWERNRWFIAWPAGTLMIDPGSADHASFVSKSWAVIFTVVGSVIRGENRTCTKCSNIFSNLINLFEVRIFSNRCTYKSRQHIESLQKKKTYHCEGMKQSMCS